MVTRADKDLSGFQAYFKDIDSRVNKELIRDQWQALSRDYDLEQWILPLPFWAKRDYDCGPKHAWEILSQDLISIPPEVPFCIYLHIPFCSSKCGFCDSYSFRLKSHKDTHIQNYVDKLCDEIRLWGQQGTLSQRPVSTVHLGGGTPNFIGAAALGRIVRACREQFNISPQTEWALEATAESLTPTMIEAMHAMGFRRLHVGVQSLQDQVRRAIGRRCSAAEVINRIRKTLERGWIVSVDLICGLPTQSLAGLLADIERLIQAGVNGYSLYELLIYPQNQRWAESYGLLDRSHLPNYWAFQAGATFLEQHGFSKSLFNHWADERDENLYFTFPSRGEDCLALGTIADGVFGDFHYRHPKYSEYLKTANPKFPGLQGGLRRNHVENALNPLLVTLLSGQIPPGEAHHFQISVPGKNQTLLNIWRENALITPDSIGGFRLTSNGSWFVGNMAVELGDTYKWNK